MKGRWYTTNDFDLYRDKLVWKYKYSTLLKIIFPLGFLFQIIVLLLEDFSLMFWVNRPGIICFHRIRLMIEIILVALIISLIK